MEDLEQRAISACPAAPRLFKRFVDDILVIWDLENGPYTILLDILNSQHSDINLTVEEELNGSLPFLDIIITRPDTTKVPVPRKYSLGIYRKPTHSNRYVHFSSAHPFSLKRNIVRGLWLHVKRLL